jgi:hypothetical protein
MCYAARRSRQDRPASIVTTYLCGTRRHPRKGRAGLNPYSLHFIKTDVVVAPVIKTCRARALVPAMCCAVSGLPPFLR